MAVDSPKVTYKEPSSCCAAFGRFFYASEDVLYFSQVVITEDDAGRCYQKNDPTNEVIPDLLDTDGGVVNIEGISQIRSLKPFRSGVLVFADNGVWFVANRESGFRATAFSIEKVSERGLRGRRSIVEAENSVYYFADSGIMRIYSNEYDVMLAEDITVNTIRSYFLNRHAGTGASGAYDEANKQIVWWNPEPGDYGLIYDLELGAFYPQQMGNPLWRVGRLMTVNNAVLYPSWRQGDVPDKFFYALSQLEADDFDDFEVVTDAFLLTGWEALGKFANKKRVTQAKVFFNKTETTITGVDSDGNYEFDAPSGCRFQARWDYDNSAAYGKWVGINRDEEGTGNIVQLYDPLRRGFIPDEFPYTFDTGESIITKKLNIRGHGDAVQFLFEAEDNKDLRLLGYSVTFNMGSRL